MRRPITISICFALALSATLWIRRELGTSMNYAGDGGPDFLRLFLVVGLAVVALISSSIGLMILWRLVFLRPDSPAIAAAQRDNRHG